MTFFILQFIFGGFSAPNMFLFDQSLTPRHCMCCSMTHREADDRLSATPVGEKFLLTYKVPWSCLLYKWSTVCGDWVDFYLRNTWLSSAQVTTE